MLDLQSIRTSLELHGKPQDWGWGGECVGAQIFFMCQKRCQNCGIGGPIPHGYPHHPDEYADDKMGIIVCKSEYELQNAVDKLLAVFGQVSCLATRVMFILEVLDSSL